MQVCGGGVVRAEGTVWRRTHDDEALDQVEEPSRSSYPRRVMRYAFELACNRPTRRSRQPPVCDQQVQDLSQIVKHNKESVGNLLL